MKLESVAKEWEGEGEGEEGGHQGHDILQRVWLWMWMWRWM